MKMTMTTPGWSAVGGQTISPYTGPIVEGETLLGHSVSGPLCRVFALN
jgi:amidase